MFTFGRAKGSCPSTGTSRTAGSWERPKSRAGPAGAQNRGSARAVVAPAAESARISASSIVLFPAPLIGGILRTRQDPHPQTAARRERRHLADRHRPAREGVDAEALQELGRHQLYLGLAEALADADAGAAAKGD